MTGYIGCDVKLELRFFLSTLLTWSNRYCVSDSFTSKLFIPWSINNASVYYNFTQLYDFMNIEIILG